MKVLKETSLCKKTWITKLGQKISINQMGDQHLINTLKMLERNYKSDCLDYAMIVGSVYPDGEPDGAAMAAASEEQYYLYEAKQAEDIEENVPRYKELLKEATKRKLPI